MTKLEDKQKEAIRTLSKLTATRFRSRGVDYVDPFIENEEKERNSRFIKSGFTDKSIKGENKDEFMYALPLRILRLSFYLIILGIFLRNVYRLHECLKRIYARIEVGHRYTLIFMKDAVSLFTHREI